MTRFLWIFAAFWVAGIADYAVQAPWWGWPIPIDMLARGPKLVWWLDWIPRDAWHIAQAARNFLWLSGAVSSAYILRSRPWWVIMAVTIGLYVLARGLSSSLILQIVR